MRASAPCFLPSLSSIIRQGWRAGVLLLCGALFGCTLITDVDREDIPEPTTPPFPEVDAGPIPEPSTPDASPPAALPDAGDAAPPDASDAAAPATDPDAGDAG